MNKKVLIVEDDEELLSKYREWLEEDVPGVEVRRAKDQVDARANITRRGPFDLIIMDGMVPNPDATKQTEESRWTFDLIRWIRQQGFTGPIVGNSSERDFGPKMTDAGCDYFAHKFEAEEVRRVLFKRLLDGRTPEHTDPTWND